MELSESQLAELRHLYAASSRHGNYQPVPEALEAFIGSSPIQPRWRDIRPRVELLKEQLVLDAGSIVVELGANTGFQTIELAQTFPDATFIAIESFDPHARFLSAVCDLLLVTNVQVVREALSPCDAVTQFRPTHFLDFNVAHHMGSDFDFLGVSDPSSWWRKGLPAWLSCVDRVEDYWFSCGFRLGGRHDLELGSPTSPSSFVSAVMDRLPSQVQLVDVFLIQTIQESVFYARTDSQTMRSLDVLVDRVMTSASLVGEFFRRPIFRFGG